MGLPSCLEEDCSSDVSEATEVGGRCGCGGGEAVAEEDGVRRSAVGDDLGGDELMDEGLLSAPPPTPPSAPGAPWKPPPIPL